MKEISFIKDKRKYLHGVVLAFAALAAGLFLYFYFFYHGPADGTVMVEIPKNATGREIGEMLEEKGVIRSLKADTIHSGRDQRWRRQFRF